MAPANLAQEFNDIEALIEIIKEAIGELQDASDVMPTTVERADFVTPVDLLHSPSGTVVHHWKRPPKD